MNVATRWQGPLPLGEGQTERVPGYAVWTEQVLPAAEAVRDAPNAIARNIGGELVSLVAAAIPIPVVGAIVAGAALALSFFGITVRGRTQHVNQGVAEQKAREFAATIGNIYQGIPGDAKEKLFELIAAWESHMYSTFASWWGVVIGRGRAAALAQYPSVQLSTEARTTGRMNVADWTAWISTVYGGNRGAWIVDVVGYYFAVIMHQADAESVNQNMQSWYFFPLESHALKPLDAFMVQKYNSTVERYLAAGGTGLDTISSGAIGWVLGAGLLLGLPLFLTSGKRQRARR